MRIAVVVHGRFHAFDLSRALIEQGHDVIVFTNYPKHIVKKFGVPPERVRSFLLHGLLARASAKLFGSRFCEAGLHKLFGWWAAVAIQREADFNAIHGFTGIAEEYLKSFVKGGCIHSIVRGSAHIRTQAQLLMEEEQRAGVPIDKPSQWMIERELREYAAADLIIVLSSFAKQSFLDQGVAAEKLSLVPLGSELKRFRPADQIIDERCQRIRSGKPLRVLTVGNFSFQKGIFDLIPIAKKMSGRMSFTFVGGISGEGLKLKREIAPFINFIPKMPQQNLPLVYNDADIFLFLTIQDGYAAVLAQAQAAGLPILATTNCAAPDIIETGKSGWVLPIRSPDAFIERLEWCDAHRNELVTMAKYTHEQFKGRDWSQVAADLVCSYQNWFASH